jgi:CRISPR associated protein Cas1
MHGGSDGSSKFIFDLMEPERPRVDRAVLDFVKGQVFNPADFIICTNGVCRLNPEMARTVVAKVSAKKILDPIGRSRRLADVADRVLGRLNWAGSAPTRVGSGRTGLRAKAAVPLRARNRFHHLCQHCDIDLKRSCTRTMTIARAAGALTSFRFAFRFPR